MSLGLPISSFWRPSASQLMNLETAVLTMICLAWLPLADSRMAGLQAEQDQMAAQAAELVEFRARASPLLAAVQPDAVAPELVDKVQLWAPLFCSRTAVITIQAQG